MSGEIFYYKRAISLSSKDMVLFIFNHENDSYINMDQVEISAPYATDADGRTVVKITGRGEVGPKGNGGYTGEISFAYRRTPLTELGLAVDGTLFDPIQGKVGFLSIVDQVLAKTGFNATAEDFVDIPFDATSEEGYVLKARADSWRFEGEINLGMPLRKDLDTGLPVTGILDFTPYGEQISKVITTHYTSFDLTPWPALVTYLTVGRRLGIADTAVLNALKGQDGKGDLVLLLGPGVSSKLNLYNSVVTYRGLLRDTDLRPYHAALDSCIVLTPDPQYTDDAIGNLTIHYNSKAVVKRLDAERTVYLMQKLKTSASGFAHAALWSQAVAGQTLGQVGTFQALSNAFMAGLGIAYEPTYGTAIKVAYNGPVTADIPLPGDDPSVKVVKLESTGGIDNPFHGSTYVYYS